MLTMLRALAVAGLLALGACAQTQLAIDYVEAAQEWGVDKVAQAVDQYCDARGSQVESRERTLREINEKTVRGDLAAADCLNNATGELVPDGLPDFGPGAGPGT